MRWKPLTKLSRPSEIPSALGWNADWQVSGGYTAEAALT